MNEYCQIILRLMRRILSLTDESWGFCHIKLHEEWLRCWVIDWLIEWLIMMMMMTSVWTLDSVHSATVVCLLNWTVTRDCSQPLICRCISWHGWGSYELSAGDKWKIRWEDREEIETVSVYFTSSLLMFPLSFDHCSIVVFMLWCDNETIRRLCYVIL